MTDKIKQTVVAYSDTLEDDFIAPTAYYYVNCLGDYVYLHTRSRAKAQEAVNEELGKGHYTVHKVMKASIR